MRRGLRVQARRQLRQRLGRLGARRQRHAHARRRAGGEPPRPHRQRRRPHHARRGRESRSRAHASGVSGGTATSSPLWGAETISQFGTQVSLLALPLVAILVLEESAFKVAALTSVEFLPFLLFTLPAGVWVDRLPAEADPRRRQPRPRGRAPVGADRALARRADDLAALRGRLRRRRLHGLLRRRLPVVPPRLVGREDVVEGNAKLEISRAAANIGGPGLGGASCGADRAGRRRRRRGQLPRLRLLWVGSASRRSRRPRGERRSLLAELGEGLRYVFRHPYQRTMVAMTALSNFFGQVVFSILLVYAVRELGLSAADDRGSSRIGTSARSPRR